MRVATLWIEKTEIVWKVYGIKKKQIVITIFMSS